MDNQNLKSFQVLQLHYEMIMHYNAGNLNTSGRHRIHSCSYPIMQSKVDSIEYMFYIKGVIGYGVTLLYYLTNSIPYTHTTVDRWLHRLKNSFGR